MTLEGCRGRWRVVLHEDVVELFKRRGLLEELIEWREGSRRVLTETQELS